MEALLNLLQVHVFVIVISIIKYFTKVKPLQSYILSWIAQEDDTRVFLYEMGELR